MFKKRIGIDARFILRPLRGMPLYVQRLCQVLPALNREYQFILFVNEAYEYNESPEKYRSLLAALKADHPNVKIVNKNHEAEMFWEQIYLPALMRKYHLDLLHMPGNRISFQGNTPIVVTVHDIIEYLNVKGNLIKTFSSKISLRMRLYNLRKMAYVWLSYKAFSRRSSKIITVSEFSARQITEILQVPSAKVVSIHHGLDDAFVPCNVGTEPLAEETSPSSRSYILMLGGDSPHKNPEGAIAAWAKVPEEIRRVYPLKIIGFCGGRDSRLLTALAIHGMQDEVEVQGWVTEDEMVRYLQGAAVFLYLSRHEGFGFPPLHAMASGTPVVASNCTSIPEVLGGVGLTYAPDDYEGIASGIVKLLVDSAVWKRESAAGMERSRAFNWYQSAQQHLRVYEEVMGERNVVAI